MGQNGVKSTFDPCSKLIRVKGRLDPFFDPDSVPEEIRDYCNRIPTLCIDDQNRIILSEGFVSIALHIIRQFFNGLLESSKKAWKAQPSAALDRRSRAALG